MELNSGDTLILKSGYKVCVVNFYKRGFSAIGENGRWFFEREDFPVSKGAIKGRSSNLLTEKYGLK
jgi:hypothetical protein